MTGALIVDKPSGPTSHDVVDCVRRALGIRRVGHTGTLDPLATGVLVVLLGPATRLAQFLAADEKEYIAHVRLGIETATYDAAGIGRAKVDQARTCSGLQRLWKREEIELALQRFRGRFLQMPPPFSAKKIAGRRAYQHARRSEPVELRPVEVVVHTLDLVEAESDLFCLRIVCSSGFYVRSLAHDLGRELGCGAHLEALRRIRAGRLSIDRAIPLDAVITEKTAAVSHVIPPGELLAHMPAVTLSSDDIERVSHGNAVGSHEVGSLDPAAVDRVRLLDGRGELVAVARRAGGGVLHPVVVLV